MQVAFTLVAVGILEQFPSTDNMFASLHDLPDCDDLPPSAPPLPIYDMRDEEDAEELETQCGEQGNSRKVGAGSVKEVRFQEAPLEKKKSGYKQRPPTPFPWDQARQLAKEENEEAQEELIKGKEKVYDSSSSESEGSYEPDFKKTDEGTVEITGVPGNPS